MEIFRIKKVEKCVCVWSCRAVSAGVPNHPPASQQRTNQKASIVANSPSSPGSTIPGTIPRPGPATRGPGWQQVLQLSSVPNLDIALQPPAVQITSIVFDLNMGTFKCFEYPYDLFLISIEYSKQ